jgi:hypothetical protein
MTLYCYDLERRQYGVQWYQVLSLFVWEQTAVEWYWVCVADVEYLLRGLVSNSTPGKRLKAGAVLVATIQIV